MEFALVALFVVLAFESYESSRSRLLVVLALTCAVVSYAFFPGNLLVPALTAYFLILIGRWRLSDAS